LRRCVIGSGLHLLLAALVLAQVGGGLLFPGPGLTPSAGFSFHKTITIDHTKVGTVNNTDQTNFPVAVAGTYSYLKTSGNGGNVQNASGFDVVFGSDSACSSRLTFERAAYAAATGAVEFWVKIPTVSHTTDTVFYMCYGNSSISTDQSNKTAVWDSNYKAVYHFGDGTTLDLTDSTSNGNNGTNHSATAGAGQLGGAVSFNGTSQYVDLGTPASLQFTAGLTMELWMSMPTSVFNARPFSSLTSSAFNGYEFFLNGSTSSTEFQIANSNTTFVLDSSETRTINVYYKYVGTFNGTTQRLYNDGLLHNSQAAALGVSSADINIGRWGAAASFWYQGLIDELRISNIARSADWIITEYNNEQSPSTFYTIT
jgi:concanavalin A-like lectin/glucanase superfamily protein/uncharacterized protein DUF2341